jgi:2-(1,2-epoxy-1,2-dihydrophenyl)acetyl-CoA isomerase
MSDENESPVLSRRDGMIFEITLNRPERYNALGRTVRAALLAELNAVARDGSIRVIILTGTGKAFCSGADLRDDFYPDLENDLINSYTPVISALKTIDKIVIAAINGVVSGIGGALVTQADLAVMSEDARLDLAFARIGLIPDGGLSWDFTRTLGYKRALRLMLEGGALSATQCLEMGIVNELVPASDVLWYAREWAKRIAGLSPAASRGIKRALHFAMDATWQQTVEFEAVQQQRASLSADFREGVAAFLEKRKPDFAGK